MRRRSNTKKEPLTKVQRDSSRAGLLNRVQRLMHARAIGMSRFPFEPCNFYRLVWGEARLNAIEALPFEMFHLNDHIKVYSQEHMDQVVRPYCCMRIQLGLKLPSEHNGMLHDDRMPAEDRANLKTWAKLRIRLMEERDQVVKSTEGLLNTAVTYGQVRAFWPTVEQFMPSHVQEQMRAYAKSRPSLAMLQAWDEGIKRCTRDVDIMLVEGAMFDTHDLSDPVEFIY